MEDKIHKKFGHPHSFFLTTRKTRSIMASALLNNKKQEIWSIRFLKNKGNDILVGYKITIKK